MEETYKGSRKFNFKCMVVSIIAEIFQVKFSLVMSESDDPGRTKSCKSLVSIFYDTSIAELNLTIT